MSERKGTDFLLYVKVGGDYKAVAGLTANSLTVNKETIDVSNKTSGQWKKLLEGQKSWGASGEGRFDTDGDYGYDELFAAITGSAQMLVRYGKESDATKVYDGEVIITSLERSDPYEDSATFSFALDGTGAIVENSIS